MRKHAYMIVSNGNLKVLRTCLSLIDDIRNDIYLSFDKKADISNEEVKRIKLVVDRSNIFVNQNFIVNWGVFADKYYSKTH